MSSSYGIEPRMRHITSAQNASVKKLRALLQSPEKTARDVAFEGDHLLAELLDLCAGRRGRGELARVDVDLVGGDDDVRDLGIIDGLGGGPGGYPGAGEAPPPASPARRRGGGEGAAKQMGSKPPADCVRRDTIRLLLAYWLRGFCLLFD